MLAILIMFPIQEQRPAPHFPTVQSILTLITRRDVLLPSVLNAILEYVIFGVALGVVFGIVLDNMGFVAIGIGAGLTLGVAIGTAMQERHNEDGA